MPMGLLRLLAAPGDLLGKIRGKRAGFDSEALEKLLGWACYRSDKIQTELGYRPSLTLAEALPEIVREQPDAGKVSR